MPRKIVVYLGHSWPRRLYIAENTNSPAQQIASNGAFENNLHLACYVTHLPTVPALSTVHSIFDKY